MKRRVIHEGYFRARFRDDIECINKNMKYKRISFLFTPHIIALVNGFVCVGNTPSVVGILKLLFSYQLTVFFTCECNYIDLRYENT